MSGTTRTVLITAGFGNQARFVIPRLASSGFVVRALRQSNRSPGPKELGAQEVLSGDASDPGILCEALRGVDAVYHIGPNFHPQERNMGYAMIEAACEAGVRHFIYSSVLHPISSDLIQHAVKRDIEERIVESGLNFTILQPSGYMQTLTSALKQDVFVLPFALERRQSLVDLSDVAEVVAKIVAEGEVHWGATYELSSDDCLTAHEIAAILTRVLQRPIRPVDIPVEQFLDKYLANLPADQIAYQREVLRALCCWYDRHDFVGNGNVLAMLLGHRPRRYAECAERTFVQGRRD